ncbi:NAD-dependent epimerase/dehydratase family protein [Glycomyces lechevalierae]|uniref:NAD-dependent epimerase/dehydratase family protein n=1 Tax=Glycomyces lechevalierae TaxID=256034 RepID=A0A9X3PR16_9ACTN|nr:NAD-dependent epimerase/dehydratase family protein [Glycomyces lechevalierae]MDA1383888.1 NAD-dependent epimerase/dehydratase family protein [Glycomyces lechevalierae]MDR7341120.1 nucleoside-diphosphate-sugar epimerase [Glycomyces lechevalierae]
MDTTPLHVVLGAGPAGTAIAAELAQRGLRVRHVSRSEIPLTDKRIERVRADLSISEAAVEATSGAAVVYHAVNVPYHQQAEVLPGITASVLTATAHHGARLVVLDTLYPYGQADGEAITERTPWAATSHKGRLRAELDRQYLATHRAGEAGVALGRAADFFGPGVLSSTLGGAFFPGALTGGKVLGLGDLALPHSYTYIGDVARGLVTLGTDPRGDGRVWHLPTNPALATTEVHRMVEELIGRPLEVDVLTELVAYGPFDEQFIGEYAEMFYQHQIPQNMVSADFEATFGVRPTPWREALQATLDWYRAAFSSQPPRG